MIKDKQCIVCGTPLEAKRSHKKLCSNACTIKLHRLRRSLNNQLKDFIFSLPTSDLLTELQDFMSTLVDNAQQHTNNQ